MGATPGYAKEYKLKLTRKRVIHCGYCRYNRGENTKHRPKPDKYKNHR